MTIENITVIVLCILTIFVYTMYIYCIGKLKGFNEGFDLAKKVIDEDTDYK